MDPVSFVMAALLAGATAGMTSTASSAVTDAYAELKRLIRDRLASLSVGSETVLDRNDVKPQARRVELVAAVTAAQVGDDAGIVNAAHRLLQLVEPQCNVPGRNSLIAQEVKGVQMGDYNIQDNTFS